MRYPASPAVVAVALLGTACPPTTQRASRHPCMKAPARMFKLSDWYGDDWDPKKPLDDGVWVSPWAKAHYKIRQQEIEIEQCEFLLKVAIEAQDFDEAGGLEERIARMKAQHPILPREERLNEALAEENYGLAAIFAEDLESVKANLGLPKHPVGQSVKHVDRSTLRGVIIDVDLTCQKGLDWIKAAGCLERGCVLEGEETDMANLQKWAQQPFYTVIPDVDPDAYDDDVEPEQKFSWRFPWPKELAAWEVNLHITDVPAAVYLSEDALTHNADQGAEVRHPDMLTFFDGYDSSPHRGKIYRPAPKLRLWQQQRQHRQQDANRQRKKASIGSVNPYSAMG